ncbi:unnamed protein product [Cylindrotheca closterium]|uniref:Uncharacterized protein n=1 Tax=Cylindrotheca closterium TaxID=2856 RepID=A0AAD2JKL0_9STRA|nr:unnamed protein product [Cylindrotheca closterium]
MKSQAGNDDGPKSLLPSFNTTNITNKNTNYNNSNNDNNNNNNNSIQKQPPTYQDDSIAVQPNGAIPTPPAMPTVPTADNSEPINPLMLASPLVVSRRNSREPVQRGVPSLPPQPKSPGGSNLPQETVEYLKAWMMSPKHIGHPYPNEDEKTKIIADTGIETKQLNNWFVNNRKRYWKPRVARQTAVANAPFGSLPPPMELGTGIVNYNANLDYTANTRNHRGGGKMPTNRKKPPPGSGKQRKVPSKKKRRKSNAKYNKAKSYGRLKKSAMPKTTLKITSDEAPNRITNPLLSTLPHKSSVEEIYGSELYRAMEVVFHPPDTYPLSYYARILGFDVPVVVDQKMPTAFPDVATLPFVTTTKKDDDPFLEIPEENGRLEYKKVNSVGCDLDDQLTLDFVDPVYATLIREGFSTKELVPCNYSIFSKFDSRRKQNVSKQKQVVAMGKAMIPNFDKNWTFSGYPASKAEGKAILEEYEWTIEEEPVPSSLPPQTFGVVAWLEGKPEAILMYQFMWYSLSRDKKESELIMIITGIGRPRRKPKVHVASSTTDVVVDGKILASDFATAPEPSNETPNTDNEKLDAASNGKEVTQSPRASMPPPEGIVSVTAQPPPASVEASAKSSNGKSDSAQKEVIEDLPNPAPLSNVIMTTMIAMILEHTRTCSVFYGLCYPPKNTLGFIQECFRLSKVPSKGNTDADTMVCDLKKCSSRYAFLKLIETEQKQISITKGDVDIHDRLLVRLPNMEEAQTCFESSTAVIGQRINRNTAKGPTNIFTGATGDMRTATIGIRALNSADNEPTPQVKIYSLQDKIQGDQLELPISTGTDSSLEILKSFPIPRSPQTEEKVEESEILLDLKRKQNELIQTEKALEPNIRSLMCKIIDERIEYEKPESRQKRADSVRLLEEHREALARRKEIDRKMQEQLEHDMNAVCSICGDGDVTPDNQILFCEACDIPIHQMCYGVEKVPEGDYYCVACRHFKRDKMKEDANSRARRSSTTAREPMPILPIRCELCPVQYGAYVRCELPKDAPPNAVTKWVHMGCAKWQGLNFSGSGQLNPECVEDVTTLKREFRRLDYACDICKGKRGAYHKCSHPGCGKWMHMTCAHICGLCEVNYGEDVEGNPTEKPWTLFCRQHSNVDPEESTYKRIPVDELISMAKEFPEEPMPVAPPPKNRIFNKMNGKERSSALANPEYERAFLDEILTKRFVGVRCECCDVEHDGSLLQRCGTCGVTVCITCRFSFGKVTSDQKYLKCHSCAYKDKCIKEEKDFEEPHCDLCYQRGGLLLHGTAKPVSRISQWKNNPKLFKKSIFGKKLWTHYSCAFWSKGVNVIPKDCSADFSNVVMSNGQGYIQGKIPCYLCGKSRGMKRRCSHVDCRARGEKRQAYHFHVSCARQAGYEVNHDDDSNDQEEFYVRCYEHGGNEYNLRARLEDLIEVERRRAGKKFGKADSPMSFSDASRLLNCAMLVNRILSWAWRWAELWVEHNSTWEPLLEPGQVEAKMTKAQLKIVESTPQSRCKDARRCRLTALGAALRNRNYDDGDSFDNESLKRALHAVLHTKSLVGPWKDFEIDFIADWLARAYRSKSRLLGLGDDKIPIGNAGFCYHTDDKSPKFELGSRPLPGKATLEDGKVFEDAVAEPDDFLKPEIIDGKVVTQKAAPQAPRPKQESSVSPKAVAVTTPATQKRGPGRPSRSTESASQSVSPFDKSAGLAALIPSAMKKRRAPDAAMDVTSSSKKPRKFVDKARKAQATIQFDELGPDGPLRRGRRGRPPRLMELFVVIQVGGKILQQDEFEGVAAAIGENEEKPVADVTLIANGNYAASQPTATVLTTQKERVGQSEEEENASVLPKENVNKMANNPMQKRRGRKPKASSRRQSLGEINYAEPSDDSEFEEQDDEPTKAPRRKTSPTIKNRTKRHTPTSGQSATKHNARQCKIDEANDDHDNDQSGKRNSRRRPSPADRPLKQSKKSRKPFVEEEDYVYENDFLIPLADLAGLSRKGEGGHKERIEERTDIDPIQIALEKAEKRTPYCVTKTERLEGRKAASKVAFINNQLK